MHEDKDTQQSIEEQQSEQLEIEKPQKLNRKQRRALNSKRGGGSQTSEQDANKNHKNRIEEKPKARRR